MKTRISLDTTYLNMHSEKLKLQELPRFSSIYNPGTKVGKKSILLCVDGKQ